MERNTPKLPLVQCFQTGQLRLLLKLVPASLLCALVCFPGAVSANPPGTLDTSFNVSSGVYGVDAVEMQPDGKVIVGGTFCTTITSGGMESPA